MKKEHKWYHFVFGKKQETEKAQDGGTLYRDLCKRCSEIVEESCIHTGKLATIRMKL